MKPFVACLAVAAVISFAVDAQALSPEQCQILATSIGDAGPSMQRMSGAVESLPLLSTLNLDLSTVKAEALAALSSNVARGKRGGNHAMTRRKPPAGRVRPALACIVRASVLGAG